MTLQGKSEGEIRELQEQFVGKLSDMGGYSGNISLQRALRWDDGTYWAIRDRLVDSGVLRRQRARGGAVALVERAPVLEQAPAAEGPPTVEQATQRERDLYEPVARVLGGDWARDNRFRHHLVENTSAQGRRNTGGMWTRPDIVVAAIRLFPYLPG